uniref:C2H2-type domain-containing protein n=1 Tax=Oryza meridionalis TaxID=40149 RepID=A0A0E0EV49_9ORYZ
MEFRYRDGDDRSRSSPPPPPPSTASSGSARVLPANEDDGHRGADGGGTGDYHGGDSDVSLGQSSPPSAAGRDELRQAKKQKIMERILREEAEEWELESEVRREIMEHIFPLLRRSGNARPPTTAAAAAAALLQILAYLLLLLRLATWTNSGAVTNANASSSAAALPAKRKNPAAAVTATMASAVSAATSSKMPKAADLTCAVCGITSTGEKAMQDHLNGKSHKKKAAALALSPPPPPPPEPEPKQEKEENDAVAMMPPASDGSFSPTKLSMLTSAGVVYEVMQMDGYLLCEGCNVRTADRVTMMCHLGGGKHVSKATKLKQQQAGNGKPPAPATATASPMNGVKAAAAAATTVAAADGEPGGTVVVEVDGEPHAMRRLDEVFIICDVCNVKAPSVTVMRSHLAGRKHKSMAAATAEAKGAEAAASTTMAAAGKVGGNLEAGAMAVAEGVATNNVADNTCPEKGTVDIVVGGEHHAVTQIGEFLGCTSCNVMATSESAMRLHLAGKKHKNKSMAEKAAMDDMEIVKARSKETAAAAASPSSAPRAVVAAQTGDGSVAPMEVDQTAEARDGGAPVAADAAAAAAATGGQQQVKVQVEGRMWAVQRQANGALLCEPCGVRCSGKTDMVLHLYTKEHSDKCGAHPPA